MKDKIISLLPATLTKIANELKVDKAEAVKLLVSLIDAGEVKRVPGYNDSFTYYKIKEKK
jgi:DNA-binding MarR family transcriptional regulator